MHFPPEEVEMAVQFPAAKELSGIRRSWKDKLEGRATVAADLEAELQHMRNAFKEKGLHFCVRLNIPLLAKLLEKHGMGGQGSIPCAHGFPKAGHLAGPGVCPERLDAPAPTLCA